MILYKYRPFDDYLEPIIKYQKIWFPKRTNLNDREDLKLKIINDVTPKRYCSLLHRLAHQKRWSSSKLDSKIRESFKSNGDLTFCAQQKIKYSIIKFQEYLDTLGILSLSDLENSRKLWKRYGDGGRCVCISFMIESSESLLQVIYKTPRPQLKLSDLMSNAEDDAVQKIIWNVLAIKNVKWSYESEWRYFVKYGNEEFSFLGEIQSITLGKNILSEKREKIYEWMAAAENQIPIRDQ